jgi:xylulokinase
MEQMNMSLKVFRAGHANMFLSPVFRQVFSNITGAMVELYDTDGAQGAARAAGVGANYYANYDESFGGLKKLMQIEPDAKVMDEYRMRYLRWKDNLNQFLDQ